MLNDKVILTPIERIKVEDGDIIKNIKAGDLGYKNFKETYYSFIAPIGCNKIYSRTETHSQMQVGS